jgi:hypothetical protein
LKKSYAARAAAAAALSLSIALTAASPAWALFGFGKKNAGGGAAQGAPVASNVNITTYEGIPCRGQFSAVDVEGDAVSYSVVSEPDKGAAVVLEDGATFVYTPMSGKSGRDSFSYTASDSSGNVSEPATVNVTINRSKTAVTYADMTDNAAYPAAVQMAEKGVMVGRQVGGKYLFEPDKTVSRSEFLTMAMAAAGKDGGEAASVTGFQDDDSIPTWAKACVAEAVDDGIVRGYSRGGKVVFDPGSAVTFSEAAEILNRMLSVSDADRETSEPSDAPAWAAQSVANLESVDVMARKDDYGAAVTRADAAQMLSAAVGVMESRRESKSVFSWLR